MAIAAVGLCLGAGSPLLAAEWAMVVGIDDYRHFQPFPAPPGQLTDLAGAVNDATRIAASMKQRNINLPDTRLLLDENATLEGFLAGWAEMTQQAAPGDTLIVTFSGHGGQERENAAPFDETTDGLDETIMFHDFDPQNPRAGRLSDDQLRKLLSEAAAFNVIWVMDSCHSAGLTRQVNRSATGLTRNGGVWDIPLDPLEAEITATEGDDGADDLPHVTQILATASEDRLVTETVFDGKAHGALSWFFAEALTGAADTNSDGTMTRAELASYLEDRVFAHMNQNQQPRILPRGDAQGVLALGAPLSVAPVAAPTTPQVVPVKFLGAPPPGLVPGSYVEVPVNATLVFEQGVAGWTVYNHTGDRITTLRNDAQRVVARATALSDVKAAKRDHLPNIRIEQGHDASAQPIGSIISYAFYPPTPDLGFLTLFNIASDGTLQYLHPLGQAEAPVTAGGFPVRFRVAPPAGADQLVAVFCDRPPLDLRRDLERLNGQLVPIDGRLSQAMARGTCQIGITGLFTTE